jgi:predicted nucleic acid-binding protein
MITAVDTSVILDILSASPVHLDSSLRLFQRCLEEGKLVICPVVWAEVRPFFPTSAETKGVLEKMNLVFDDFGEEVASKAGEIWRRYRHNRGPRERVIADFLIGAHASLKADRLLTRDRGYYRSYFRDLKLVTE